MRMDYCGKSMAIRGILFLLAFCFVLAATNSLEAAVMAMIVVTFPFIAVDMKWARQFEGIRPHITVEKAIGLAISCAPGVAGVALSSAIVAYARQSLGTIEGQAILGMYASICTPTVIVQAGAGYVYAPLLGTFARRFAEGRFGDFARLLARTLGYMAAIFVVGALAFAFGGEWFLSSLFGSAIVSYSGAMYAALLSTALCAIVSFLCDLLIGLRLSWGVLWGNALSVIAAVPLAQSLIPVLGMDGASFAISIAYVISSTIMLLYLWRAIRRL